MLNKKPMVGIATIVKTQGTILFGKRKNSHGSGTLGFPGGHLEKFESFYDCATRELKEETGLIAGVDVIYNNKDLVSITNDFFKKEDKHYVTLYLLAEQVSKKQPKVIEPNKIEKWEYFSWNYIKNNKDKLFLPIQNLIKQGYNPFD